VAGAGGEAVVLISSTGAAGLTAAEPFGWLGVVFGLESCLGFCVKVGYFLGCKHVGVYNCLLSYLRGDASA
jgi:hypothetical protein